MIKQNSVLAVLLLFASVSVATWCPPNSLTVETQRATVQGFWSPDGETRNFLGIPYAAPPVGALRFAPPENPPRVHTILPATNFGPICLQTPVNNATMSEDCLYLNIFTPKEARCGTGYPVMVWFHGGRYWTGQTDQHSGEFLPKLQDIILVTVAYRLNIFGFFHLNSLLDDGAANVGLQDQRFSLKWISRNIEAFGGDPDRVLISGASAGGGSVLDHLIMTGGGNTFQSAVMQSTWQWRYPTATQAVNGARAFVSTLGCTGSDWQVLNCVRSKPATLLVPTIPNSDFFTPAVDGELIRDQPLTLLQQGKFKKDVDVIVGLNMNEGYYMAYTRSGFIYPNNPANSWQKYFAAANAALSPYFTPAQVQSILNYYNASSTARGSWYGLSDLMGDYYINCGSYLGAAAIASKTRARIHAYNFNYTSPNSNGYQFQYAAHSTELTFIFGKEVYGGGFPMNADDLALRDRMMRAWARMAKQDTPYAIGWQEYNGRAFIWKQPPTGATVPFSKPACAFWEPLFTP